MISPDINANPAGVLGGSSSSMSDKALTQLHKLQVLYPVPQDQRWEYSVHKGVPR